MSLPPVAYLSMDSIVGGVGASQVLPYVRGLARRDVEVLLHTFEPEPAPPLLRAALDADGIRWDAHPMGALGSRGGLARLARAAAAVRGAELVHARSDLAAGAALLARPRSWVWDVRSFWADQRIALDMLRAGSPEERVLRWIERTSARRADAIITLTDAALPVLEARHGRAARDRATVVTTCVDLDRFALSTPSAVDPLRFLLSGSINTFYDVPLMLRLVARSRERRATELDVLTPGPTSWDDAFAVAGARHANASPAEVPPHVARSHCGLVVCREDAGVSLRAAMPTKLGEFLACGRPVIVNPSLGDAAALLAQHRCGVTIDASTDDAVERALDELDALLSDPGLPGRCRALAEEHFDLDRAVDALVAIYRRCTS